MTIINLSILTDTTCQQELMVTFSEENPSEAVSNPKDTTLIAWFALNQNDP